jgi:hypothetical protein
MALLTLGPVEQQQKKTSTGRLIELAKALFRQRTRPAFGWIETAVLAIYCAVLAVAIPAHEAWGDEAQAWLIDCNTTFWQMVRHRLHYEGSPPLWHALLRAFYLAHGTYAHIGWFGAAFAVAGVYVLLRWSPFPLIVRLLLPFTFFLQYQYAVIARSYNLFPLLAFTLCALYPYKRRIVWFALVAGLLANLSMQGTEFASVLSGLYLFDLYRAGRQAGYTPPRRRLVAAGLLFVALAGLAFYTAIPAPDVNFAVKDSVSDGPVHRILVGMFGMTPPLYPYPPTPDAALPRPPEPPMPHLFSSPGDWTAWQINHRDLDAHGQPGPQSWLSWPLDFLINIASQATWPVAMSNLLACVFLGVLLAWLRQRRSLRLLLPWLMMMALGQILWVTDHHAGMILIALLAAIWIAALDPAAASRALSPIGVAFTAIFALVLALQVGWTAVCIHKDLRGNYDPGRETAEYLQQHPVARTAGFDFWQVSIQPYFDRNPFFNIPTRYWAWSWNADPDYYYRDTVALRPDRIVYSVEFPGDGLMRNQWVPVQPPPTLADQKTLPWDLLLQYFHAHGYVETHRFCGDRFSRLRYSFRVCDLILEPAPGGAQ